MSEGIHASVGAIQDLEVACGRFAAIVIEHLPVVEDELRRASESLEERRADLRNEISRLTTQIDSADEEEDTAWLQNQLEEAQGQMAAVRRRMSRLTESATAYQAQARRLEDLANDHTRSTREFLQGAAQDLRAYFALNLDPVTCNAGKTPASGTASAAASTEVSDASPTTAFDPTAMPLPAGFVWVPLDQIDLSPDRGGFKDVEFPTKTVSREEMVRGFNALKAEILPAIAGRGVAADDDYFRKLDQDAGGPHESGVLRPFEAFFGSEPIYLTHERGTGLLNATSGRHRILVAGQLGWKAVPAKVEQPETK